MTKIWTTKNIAENAVVAAIYFVLCLIATPVAYGQIQFRIAEILVLLCFWRRDFVVGVTLGCFLANINSSLGPFDMLFGTLATLVSSIMVAISPRLIIGVPFPILVNAFVVAGELYFLADVKEYWLSCLYVGLGEGAVILGAYVLCLILARNKSFMKALDPSAHREVTF